jgi:hypothetical protein
MLLVAFFPSFNADSPLHGGARIKRDDLGQSCDEITVVFVWEFKKPQDGRSSRKCGINGHLDGVNLSLYPETDRQQLRELEHGLWPDNQLSLLRDQYTTG